MRTEKWKTFYTKEDCSLQVYQSEIPLYHKNYLFYLNITLNFQIRHIKRMRNIIGSKMDTQLIILLEFNKIFARLYLYA